MSLCGPRPDEGSVSRRASEDQAGFLGSRGYISSASSLIRSVTTASADLTRRWWNSEPPQRPFRVCNHDRSRRKGLTAGTLRELVNKALDALLITGVVSMVLEEDGTAVDTEDFFDHLDNDTVVMVLEKGQRWTSQRGMVSYALTQKPKNSKDIARITFDIYKLNPKDLFGSVNIRATFYGLYSMTFDIKCLGPKKVIRELLRAMSTLLYGIGHLLLTASSFTRRAVEGSATLVEYYD
ncbi:cell death activator CIDE-B [Mobula hypostoma]|uniref:cell death activator CIDE-B n=1 Tax=Mobula hypostoma TaxID=723540 RepID=UPI002FC2AA86